MATTLATRLPAPATNVTDYLRAVRGFPLLSADEERELALRYQREQDIDAGRQLITSHLRYVVKIARGYRGYGLSEADLIQEGNIGLIKAVKRFDPRIGVRLAAFAVYCIRAEMYEFVLSNWRIVKIAATKAQRKLFFNLRGAKKRAQWLSREEVAEIAEDLGVRPGDVREMEQRLHARDAAFDEVADAEEDRVPAPAGLLEDRRYEPTEVLEEAERTELVAAQIATGLGCLDDRSRDIVTRRWLREPRAKLRELAEEYQISAERVRQIEANAFAVLRESVEPPSRPGSRDPGAGPSRPAPSSRLATSRDF